MRNETTPSRSIIIHRIKTSLYALSTVVLAGWVTDALNEDLMFRLVTRYFFPEAVAQYEHPFTNMTSALIWGIPLLIGLALALLATMLTVHHLKKRHIYTLDKAKKLGAVENVILCVSEEDLEKALGAYVKAHHIHIIVQNPEKSAAIRLAVEKVFCNEKKELTLHPIPETSDLHGMAEHLTKLIHLLTDKADRADKEVVFDIRYASPLVSCAAMYASLETNLGLSYPDQGIIYEYDTECVMES